MEKEIIELVCDYCKMPITEHDYKCPKCGADCSNKIKKYQAQKEIIKAEQDKINREQSKKVYSTIGKVFMIPIIIFVIIIVIVIALSISATVNRHTQKPSEPVTVNEAGESADCTVTLDSYELYTYVSDDFPEVYNAPKGYQKIAFHFTYLNQRDSKHFLSNPDISLKADGYQVEMSELQVGTFERVEVGQEKYTSILNTDVDSGEQIQGYVGFLVPKNAKTLYFTFDGIKIKMDNPVYEAVEK